MPAILCKGASLGDGEGKSIGKMNRLYVVECGLSITGGSADHRLALRRGDVGRFASMLQKAVWKGLRIRRNWANGNSKGGSKDVARFAVAVAQDLLAIAARAWWAVGAGQPAEVAEIVRYLNQHLENFGKTVSTPVPRRAWLRRACIAAVAG